MNCPEFVDFLAIQFRGLLLRLPVVSCLEFGKFVISTFNFPHFTEDGENEKKRKMAKLSNPTFAWFTTTSIRFFE
jgi:hypothetical protein